MEKFIRPKFTLISESEDLSSCVVEMEPLERGFGHTIGNTIRRILLSSIPGAAAYGIKIKKVMHEFSTIPGVVEDVPSIILQVKQLVIKVTDVLNWTDNQKIILKIENIKGEITGKDIICPAGISIENPDLYIATTNKATDLSMEIYVRIGRGVWTFNENKSFRAGMIDLIAIDSNFSPVLNVSLAIEPTKIGHEKDLEKLVMKVQTNKCVTAKEALSLASKVAVEYFEEMISWSEKVNDLELIIDAVPEEDKSKLNLTIAELNLSVRALNSLKKYGIERIEELTTLTRQEVMAIKNMGKKTVDEIADVLKEHSLTFKNE